MTAKKRLKMFIDLYPTALRRAMARDARFSASGNPDLPFARFRLREDTEPSSFMFFTIALPSADPSYLCHAGHNVS